MGKQREKPGVTADELESTLGVRPVFVSGGQIENFREGWAHHIFSRSEKAHYFKRDGFDKAAALCGATAPVRWLYGAGTYPHCKNCEKAKKA